MAVGSAIVLAGCQADPGAAPEPTRPAPIQAGNPIPPVTKNARDVAAMARRPCELLTSQQAMGFRLDLPPQQLSGLLGTLRCKWSTATREQEIVRTVDVSMFTDNSTLETIYSRRQGY
ncbi:MAG TPA: hypothetical protein VGP04_20515, partial [Pseudonocardiaceae bacterium]|nr:hypothetical protein [Pseudonocardiaceae bacterium]